MDMDKSRKGEIGISFDDYLKQTGRYKKIKDLATKKIRSMDMDKSRKEHLDNMKKWRITKKVWLKGMEFTKASSVNQIYFLTKEIKIMNETLKCEKKQLILHNESEKDGIKQLKDSYNI